MQIFLVSFADSKYARTLARFRNEAIGMGLFDDVFCWNESDLDPVFLARHREFIALNPRGYGYWIWKAQVVKQALAHIPETAYLFYADAGCTMNPGGAARLVWYCEMMSGHPSQRLVFQLEPHLSERKWTKKHTLQELAFSDPSLLPTAQLVGGIFGLRKVPHNEEFIDIFCSASQRYDLINDEHPIPNDPEFIKHRHDQSVWSVLNKLAHPAPLVLPNETETTGSFPFRARRLKY